MTLEPWQWALAVTGALMSGMAKTGVPGLSILPVVMMCWVAPDARLAGGIILPLLCVADVIAVWHYHHHAQWRHMARLSPWVGAGVVAGAGMLWWIYDDTVLNRIVAVVILTMVLLQGIRQARGDAPVVQRWWVAAAFGVTAGFATTIANAAGPVMAMYLLSMALPKEQFMGTGAWFFCIINLVKIPLFCFPDQAGQARITAETVWLDMWLIPAVVVGTWCGRRVFAYMSQKIFTWIVLVLAGTGSVVLLFH